MKVLLVRPFTPRESISLADVYITEPLELENLYTILKGEFEVKILDFQVIKTDWRKVFYQELDADVVCFTGYKIHVNVIKTMAAWLKKTVPSIVTIVGGVHAEWMGEDFDSPGIDIVVKKFSLVSLKKLFSLLKEGKVQEALEYDFTKLPDQAEGCLKIVPDRLSTRKWRKNYSYLLLQPAGLLRTSYGCPYRCSFCIRWKMTGGVLIYLSPEDVIEEIKRIPEDNIFILDDNFLMDRKRLKKIINLLKKEGIKKRFLSYGRVDFIVKNEDLIRELAEVGFVGFLIGVESHRKEDLVEYHKQYTMDELKRCVEVLKKYNLDFCASLILKPDFTFQDFRDLREFLAEMKFDFLNMQPYVPFPKTQEFSRWKDRLIISVSEHEKWDFAHQVIRPFHMSEKDFYREILKTYLYFYFRVSPVAKKIKKYGVKPYLNLAIKSLSLIGKMFRLCI